ncbi:MAG: conjugal transfer protein TraF, partial [Burkholderiaceae bacterium]|nr:conjugal transfer protein TraF [Burkholderiaceae bacterium]
IIVIDPDCPYCDLMAPIARKLNETFGFEVLAINAGKKASIAWPEAKPDNGTLRVLMERTNEPITTTPTIFLVHRDRTRIHRVATGVVALEELIHRMHTVTSVPPGHSLFGGQP